LLNDGYEAVFLAVGTPEHRTLGVPGEDLPGVIPALQMLRQLDRGDPVTLGTKVVVVGGGDVAMDAVRSSMRLCSARDVMLVYRRGREEMPADREEVEGAEHEGVRFVFLRAPVRIAGAEHVTGLVVQRVELGPPDAGGRRSPLVVPDSEETIPCDTVIVAVGQRAALEGFEPELDLRVTSQGWPEGKGAAFATGVAGIFAAGGKSVVYAMGAAQEAAEAIDQYLARKRGETASGRPDPFGGTEGFRLPAGYTKPIRS
jgi:NADPH-dependent glutamate synthase beta subunit-like oxidoreductase